MRGTKRCKDAVPEGWTRRTLPLREGARHVWSLSEGGRALVFLTVTRQGRVDGTEGAAYRAMEDALCRWVERRVLPAVPAQDWLADGKHPAVALSFSWRVDEDGAGGWSFSLRERGSGYSRSAQGMERWQNGLLRERSEGGRTRLKSPAGTGQKQRFFRLEKRADVLNN